MTTLVIVRHGNTFEKDETPTRVGARTDIPLSLTGVTQAQLLEQYFKNHNVVPDKIYSAELKRTQQTAKYVFPEHDVITLPFFNEIDYGPDENKPEEEVIKRIGIDAIDKWNKEAIVPPGWHVDVGALIKGWQSFGAMIKKELAGKTVFVFTSNGIARFAAHLSEDYDAFCQKHPLKIKTGAFCVFQDKGSYWDVLQWNVSP